jgi:hypothetical protein
MEAKRSDWHKLRIKLLGELQNDVFAASKSHLRRAQSGGQRRSG